MVIGTRGLFGTQRVVLLAATSLGLWLVVGLAGPAWGQDADVREAASAVLDLDREPWDLLATIEAHEATVLVWYATSCPCVARYEGRIAALREAWPPERVAMIGVASNADDDAAAVRARLDAHGFPLPVVLDPGGALARALEVISTPTVVLLDASGSVRFRGWIDNEREPGDDRREPYLEEAIEALLAERTDGPTDSRVYGCPVTRSW